MNVFSTYLSHHNFRYTLVGQILLLVALLLPTFTSNAYALNNTENTPPKAKKIDYKPTRYGDYEIHYSAFNSTFIPAEMAQSYTLKRDKNYGIVNIAIRNVKDSASGKAVTADIKGQHKNLMTQVKTLDFIEVKESDAIYYLAQFKFSNEELLKFTIDIKPTSDQHTEVLRFEQTFYEQ